MEQLQLKERLRLFRMEIYRKRVRHLTGMERLYRAWILAMKMAYVLIWRVSPWSLAATVAWYCAFYRTHIDVGTNSEGISTAAWLPWLAVTFTLICATAFAKVFDKYVDMRIAIKKYDLETFMALRDEDLSPLIYLLITVFAVAVVGGFMLLHYPNLWSGALFVWTSSFMAALFIFVIHEVDNPLDGVWFIRNVHSDWADLDVRVYPAYYYPEMRKKCEAYFKACVEQSEVVSVSQSTTPKKAA